MNIWYHQLQMVPRYTQVLQFALILIFCCSGCGPKKKCDEVVTFNLQQRQAAGFGQQSTCVPIGTCGAAGNEDLFKQAFCSRNVYKRECDKRDADCFLPETNTNCLPMVRSSRNFTLGGCVVVPPPAPPAPAPCGAGMELCKCNLSFPAAGGGLSCGCQCAVP